MGNTVNIHNKSDVGITCTQCGASFTGQAQYSKEISGMFINHWHEIHEITEGIDLAAINFAMPQSLSNPPEEPKQEDQPHE